MLHTPWKELIFLATFLKFTCYVYTIRVAPMFCWSPMKKNPTYQSLHSVRSSLWVISSLLNMRFARFPFCFLLGAAIVCCTYCYVKPLRYLIIRKTSNSTKTLRTHRILKLQNRNKTWNLSCNNIPKIIQLTHTHCFILWSLQKAIELTFHTAILQFSAFNRFSPCHNFLAEKILKVRHEHK